ncbi:MAG: polyprenyl synthetase family protein [Ardenticatenaceae bacterium]|nr:polyprenyl synthetase family protein [Ardenticatenaceae bacterium]
MSSELKTLSQTMLAALNEEMRSVLQSGEEQPDSFYGMIHYHMGWVNEQLQPVQVYPGKQIRPLLCLLTCQAAGGDWQQALPAAAAIEILHNFSLVHDDIEDASPTRRGRQTMWQIWGIEQAINTGDAMFALAHLAMSRLLDCGVPAPIVVQALRRFDETCVRLTQGQHADMDFEKRDGVTVAEYMAMIEGKTAVLVSLAAELGARIAGAEETAVAHYAQFGLELGLAFQVKDDILGIWGDEALTGKSAATDITTKKKTLPVLYGLEHSAELRQLYTQNSTDENFVSQAIQHLDTCGARAFTESKASAYSEGSFDHLQAAQPHGAAALALHELTNMLLQRNS